MSMQWRIAAGVAVGMALILGAFGFFALTAVSDSRASAEQARLRTAETLVAHVNSVVDGLAGRTALVARRLAEAWSDGTFPLDQLHADRAFLGDAPVAVTDAGGAVRFTSGAQPVPTGPSVSADAGVTISPCRLDGRAHLCLAAPLAPDTAAPARATLTVAVDPADPAFNLLPAALVGSASNAELLDAGAGMLAASHVAGNAGDHAEVLLGAIAASEPVVAVHGSHVVAYTPLASAPGWGVAVEQERDIALAAADRLEDRFLIFGPIALVLAVAIAWLDVRQVVRPVRRLTGWANRIAAGDLATPETVSARGEVGELARAFETMRRELQASHAEIERRDRELEDRVRARTAEVQRLYAALREKEEARSLLLGKVIRAEEEERARIARELHDDTAQALTAVVMSLEAAEADLEPEPGAARRGLRRAREIAADSIRDVRKLIANLRPTNLDQLGLVPAIRMLAEERLEALGVTVELTTQGMDARLPAHVEIGVYRIVQEAVSNIARHADARRARLHLQQRDGIFRVSIQDDGVGFDAATQARRQQDGRGLGLLGLEERAAILGGTATIASTPGAGTAVTVVVPLQHERAA